MGLLGRMVGAATLIAALGGCVDVSYDIDVTSDATAKATMTQVMARSTYDTIQANKDVTAPSTIDRNFCKVGTMAVGDNDVTCTIVNEGPFAKLTSPDLPNRGSVEFFSMGPGLVRVVFPIGNQKPEPDETLAAMWEEMAAGHTVSLKVTGGEIVATNMGVALDKSSASIEMPLNEVLAGTSTLPDELFAIVKVKQP